MYSVYFKERTFYLFFNYELTSKIVMHKLGSKDIYCLLSLILFGLYKRIIVETPSFLKV